MDRHNPELMIGAMILASVGWFLVSLGQWLIGSILVGVTVLYSLIGMVDTVIGDIIHMKSRNIIVLLALMCGSFFLLRSGIPWEAIKWALLVTAGIMLAAIAELIARVIVIFRYVLGIF